MEKVLEVALMEFGIPLWQIIVYIGFLGFFMLTWRIKAFFATSYLFILYWGYAIFRPYFLATVGTGLIPIAVCVLFALALAGLLLYALSLDMEIESFPSFPTREVAHLRKTLLRRMDKMEKALFSETQTKFKEEGWKLEEIQQEMDTKLLTLQSRLEEENAARKESELQEIQQKLSGRIQELESQVQSKEELLAARGRAMQDLGSQAKASLDSLQVQLREREEALEAQKTQTMEEEKKRIAKIDELESQLSEQLGQLVTRSCELEETRSASEGKVASLEANLREKVDALNRSQDSIKKVKESLGQKIQLLETQLKEKEELLPWEMKEVSPERLRVEYPPTGSIREKIEALLEPEMERLWADLVEKGMLSAEREKEAQIIQQKIH